MATVCDLGRPEVAAACSFAAMLAGNVKAVKLITCTMVDQVRAPSIGLERDSFGSWFGCRWASAFQGAMAVLWQWWRTVQQLALTEACEAQVRPWVPMQAPGVSVSCWFHC